MSVSKWAYSPEKCDGDFCIGDCDLCNKTEDKDDEVFKTQKNVSGLSASTEHGATDIRRRHDAVSTEDIFGTTRSASGAVTNTATFTGPQDVNAITLCRNR